MNRLRRWLGAALRRRRFEHEMQQEMEAHLALRAEELERSGVSSTEARRQARLEFGSVEGVKEGCREARGLSWWDETSRNLRFAARSLSKSPAITVTVVATLGLAIGANVAVFSVVDAVLLRPLPYPQPDELGLVVTRYEQGAGVPAYSGASWEVLRDGVTRADLSVFSSWSNGTNLVAGDLVRYVEQQRVGAGFFAVLGVRPILGRGFTVEEDVPDGAPVVVLGFDLWQRAFGGETSVLGEPILLGGKPHVVVGVMPEGFRTNVAAQLWTPLRASTEGEGQGQNYTVLARPKDGESLESVGAELLAMGGVMAEVMRNWEQAGASLGVTRLQAGLTQGSRRGILLAWLTVGLVLMVACLNVAGLLLARAIGRTHEIAARLALGGTRWAILRQLLTESLVLALMGGLLGLALGGLGVNLLRESASRALSIWQPVGLDGRVILSTTALTVLTAVLSGLLPALRASALGRRLSGIVGSARSVSGGSWSWQRRALVGAQVALVMVLLVGAGLLLRSLLHLHGLEAGFDPERVVAGSVSLDDGRYATRESVEGLFTETLARLRTAPGVQSAAVGLSLPFQRPLNLMFGHVGARAAADGESHLTNLTYVTPGYFETLRIPLLQGRLPQETDGTDAPAVIVVNRAFARAHFESGDALGSKIAISGQEREIVGVVQDVQQTPSWSVSAPLGTPPAVFMPLAQASDGFFQLVHTWFRPSWVVRIDGPRAAVASELERAVQAVDPMLPLARFRSVQELQGEALSRERFMATILAATAILALVLSAVGIAALIASAVLERRRELGVRLALGATVPRAVLSSAWSGVALTGIGVAVGCFLAWGGSRLLEHSLHGVTATDAKTFVVAGAVQLLVAAIASLVPSLRVASVDPVETLRAD